MRFTNANSYSDGTFSDSDLYGYGYGYGSFRNSDAYGYGYGYGTFSNSDRYGNGNRNGNRDAHAAGYPNAEAGSDSGRAYGQLLFL